MKFSIGDAVIIKHTKEEGVIVSDEDKGMHQVLIKGIEIPVFKENMDHPYFDWFSNEKNKKKNLKNVKGPQIAIEDNSPKSKINQGLYLGFFPIFDNKNIDEIAYFKLYIINQTEFYFNFNYSLEIEKKKDFSHKGQLLPFTNFYIHNISKEAIADLPILHFQLFNNQNTAFEKDIIKLRPQKVAKMYYELLNNNKAFSTIDLNYQMLQIAGTNPVLKQLGANIIEHNDKQDKVRILKPSQEIDLHIEKITDQYSTMSNTEMLQLQLDTFEKALSISLATKQDSLIVIHGVGKGKLKNEIHRICRSEMMVRQFQNEWSPKYGYGATVIFFEMK